jgi:small conductance mechanosensitive channel
MLPILPLSLLTATLWLTNPDAAADSPDTLSAAERIARLVGAIAGDQKRLQTIKAMLDDPAGEYRQAETEFRELDAQLDDARRSVRELRAEGKEEEAARRADEVKELTHEWESARDRFNLAITERKTLQQKAAALTQKVRQDQQALAELVGPTGDELGAAPAVTPAPADPAAAEPAAAAAPREVVKAQEELRQREAAAREASDRAQTLTGRIEALRHNLQLEQTLLATSRRRSDQAHQEQGNLEKELQAKLDAGAPEPVVQGLLRGIAEARQRATDARIAVRACTDRIQELHRELTDLQQQQVAALAEAEQKQRAALEAQQRLAELENPLAPRNVVRWALTHAGRLVVILLGMGALYHLVRLGSRQIVRILVRSGNRGTVAERHNRAQTLVGVFRSAASLAILGGGTLMILDTLGIPIVPLLGGAAVLGLAVAFGAQNLIKDYFSGFMVLLEDQYGLDDVVRIGGISGKVERISMRVTVLRDVEGVVHFIPHGTISSVSNLTHGWSRAFFEIGVSYRSDVDRVMEELMDLARELRRDPKFGPLILDEPEMLGVDAFADSAVVIKFFIKTRPLQQWPVKRQLLRRIKKRFDQVGIEIPFPHRTVYHRYEGGAAAERPPRAA